MKINKHLILILILGIGFGIRFFMIASNDFWSDEAYTFFLSRDLSLKNFLLGTDPQHTFLYYFLIKALIPFNTSIIYLRLPSLIFSLLNNLLIYKIAENLNINKYFAPICAFLWAISPYQIEYSWWARMYSLVLLFALFSTFSMLKFFQSKKLGWGWLFILSNIGGFYTDYSFIWYLIIINLFTFFFLFKLNKKIILLLITSDAIISLYLPIFFNNLSRILLLPVNGGKKPNYQFLKATIVWFFGIRDVHESRIKDIWLFPLILIVIAVVFLYKKERKKLIYILAPLFLFFLCLALSYSTVFIIPNPIFTERNFVSISFLPIFLVGLLFSSLIFQRSRVLKLTGIFTLCIFIYFNLKTFIGQTSGIYFPRKEGWFFKKAASYIKINADLKNDYLFFTDKSEALFDYYIKGYDKNKKEELIYQLVDDCNRIDFLTEKRNLWIITAPWPIKDPIETLYSKHFILKSELQQFSTNQKGLYKLNNSEFYCGSAIRLKKS